MHGLIIFGVWVCCITHKRAKRSGQRKPEFLSAQQTSIHVKRSKQSRCYSLNIAFCTRNLTCKNSRSSRNSKRAVKRMRRVNKRVSVHDAVANKLSVFQSWDEGKYAFLLSPGKICLKTNQIKCCLSCIFCAKLNCCPGAFTRSGVNKSYWLQSAKSNGIMSCSCHFLNRLTSLEQIRLLKIVANNTFSSKQLIYKCVIFFFIHGAIKIIANSQVLITRLREDN